MVSREEVMLGKKQAMYGRHLWRCKKCAKDWLEVYKTVPEDKKSIRLEEIVDANHPNGNII